MKKLLALVLGATMLLGGCGGGTSSDVPDPVEKYGSDTLKLYNWGEYMGEDLINNFQKEFGVKVITEYFDSNEMMYTKIQAGDSYDVLVPSDYMIERLIANDSLMELDKSLIPNEANLYDGVKNLAFDPEGKYSVPYFWGSVGIVYNKNNVSIEDLEKEGYNILKDEKYKGKIYMYDSERDSFMVALKALGYSMNTDNEKEIEEAYNWLIELNNTMEPSYVTDEVIDNMANGMKDMAVVYSGDAAYILSQNEDMGFFLPNEGTNMWCDAMVIPKNAENPKLAHEFINYVLTYDASYDNSYTVGYASTNKDVLKDMSSEGGEYFGNEAYIPRTGYEKDEVFRDNQVLKEKLANLWIKVKASN
ncbi:MAG TPA: ABC transporter substrate-binding protein [Candidatus Fimicola cottocaccae]|uniref:ABC transporter substrate-binding protein n=1 Tax=Tyzzerella sp. An114 TaxID=1965545 RepID=UPI0013DD916D|nr:ABC transporter substrate-binding protein [Tyzzerella sp. An114]HIT72553.1 ABC transporter substrate-binding protein [Candidatus Fimicola cottocaccae]